MWINKIKDNNSVLNSVSGTVVDKVIMIIRVSCLLYDINRELLGHVYDQYH